MPNLKIFKKEESSVQAGAPVRCSLPGLKDERHTRVSEKAEFQAVSSPPASSTGLQAGCHLQSTYLKERAQNFLI